MIALLGTAFALDCTDPAFSGPSCSDVNLLAAMLESQTGTAYIADTGVETRFRSASLYTRFESLRAAIAASGCGEPTFADAGVYTTAGVGVGTLEQTDQDPSDLVGNFVTADIHRPSGSFTGTWGGPGVGIGGVYGALFAQYSSGGRVLADWGTAPTYVAGFWIRTVGRNGIWVNLEGTACPNSAEQDLMFWFNP